MPRVTSCMCLEAWVPVGVQIAPKEDEVKALAKYAGALGTLSPPEAFLATMASVPRLMDKINLLILVQQFEVPARSRQGLRWALLQLHASHSLLLP